MALRDQPYLPLFIKDFITDEKLVHCSPAANGILIRLMCMLHKEEVYGKVLLKQKYKQNGQQKGDILTGFALQFDANLPWKTEEIRSGLDELLEADVIQIKGFVLSQKRMVRDGIISDKRASAGKEGGKKTQENNKNFASNFAKAKSKANTANAIEYENGIKEDIKDKGAGKRKKTNPPHHFHQSPFFDLQNLMMAFLGTKYQDADFDHYHESADIWSRQLEKNKKQDWKATIQNFMKKDLDEGKLKLKINGTHQQGTTGLNGENGNINISARSVTRAKW